MKQLFKFLSSYKKECIFAPLFKLFEATLELFVPLVMAEIMVLLDGWEVYWFFWQRLV